MRSLCGALCGALTLLVAPSAIAQPLESWRIFQAESTPVYVRDDDSGGWDYVLWRAFNATEDADAAIGRFAAAFDLEPAIARRYAEIIVHSAIINACRTQGGHLLSDSTWEEDEAFSDMDLAAEAAAAAAAAMMAAEAADAAYSADGWGDAWSGEPSAACQAVQSLDLLADARDTILAEPTGELLYILLRDTEGRGFSGASADLVSMHPNRQYVLRRLYEWGGSWQVQMALVAMHPDSEEALAVAGSGLARDVPLSGQAAGWMEAIIETAGNRAVDEGAQLAYQRALLLRGLEVGLEAYSAEIYLSASPSMRVRLISRPGDCQEDACDGTEQVDHSTAASLAAALLLTGYRQEALQVLDIDLAQDPRQDGPPSRQLAALNEAARPTLSPAEMFEPFVLGDPDEAQSEDDHSFEGTRGWLFALHNPLQKRALVERFEVAGYSEIADHLRTAVPYDRESMPGQAEVLAELARALGPDAQAARTVWAARLDGARRPSPGAPLGQTVGTPALNPIWTESRIASATPVPGPTLDGDYPEPPNPPFSLPDYVSPYGVIRAEEVEGERVVLFQSSEYDLPGEIPAYGLWLVRTENGVWRDPSYLGLQTLFPYVPVPASSIPLIQEGRLTMEVQVREIDPATITFPPVGLGFLRQEDGLLLSASLADIERDAQR